MIYVLAGELYIMVVSSDWYQAKRVVFTGDRGLG